MTTQKVLITGMGGELGTRSQAQAIGADCARQFAGVGAPEAGAA